MPARRAPAPSAGAMTSARATAPITGDGSRSAKLTPARIRYTHKVHQSKSRSRQVELQAIDTKEPHDEMGESEQ